MWKARRLQVSLKITPESWIIYDYKGRVRGFVAYSLGYAGGRHYYVTRHTKSPDTRHSRGYVMYECKVCPATPCMQIDGMLPLYRVSSANHLVTKPMSSTTYPHPTTSTHRLEGPRTWPTREDIEQMHRWTLGATEGQRSRAR